MEKMIEADVEVDVEDIYSLSLIQKGMLLHSLSSPEASDLYVAQMAAELEGPLNRTAFEKAWQMAVDQHPTLRTSYFWEEFDDPVQVVHRQVKLPVAQEDWRDLSEPEQDARLESWLESDRKQGISVSEAPLCRLAILRLGEENHLFVLTFHTLLLDGWSKGVLLKTVLKAYEGLSNGRTVEGEPPTPFKDYMGWLKNQDFSQSEGFWRRQLEGFAAPVPVCSNGEGTPSQESGFGDHYVEIEADGLERMQSFARQRRLTVNTLVQAVWALLLSRYSGRQDVLFGGAVSGRPTDLTGADSIVGFMINTVPVRIQVREELPVQDWLQSLQESQNELRNYENTPLPQIRQWSDVPAAQPLFESVMLFENWPDVQVLSRFKNLQIIPLVRTMYPLTLCILPQDSRLRIHMAYDRGRLDAETARQVLEHFQSVMQAILSDAAQPVSRLFESIPPGVSFRPPSAVEKRAKGEFVAPRNPREEAVAEIGCDLLGLERIGVEDSFLELGVQSLFATQFIARIQQQFQVDLPLQRFFQMPTVAGVAAAIDEKEGDQAAALSLPQIEPDADSRNEPFELTDIQQAYLIGRSASFETGNLASSVYLELECSDLDLGRFGTAWQSLIERHDMLRAIVLAEGKQRILPPGEVPAYQIKSRDLSGKSAQEQQSALEETRRQMFDPIRDTEQWPLFEVRATQLGQGQTRLHFYMDLLTIDAGSVSIFFRELVQLYRDPESHLPPLDLSYRDYVLAQAALRDSEVSRRSREYWFQRAPDFPRAPDLPLAGAAASDQAPEFSRREAKLDAESWERIKKRASQIGVTPSGILLAAFSEVLALWCRSPKFTINIPMFNRLPLHPQINDIVGDFTSVNLLAVDNSLGDGFENLARRIQSQLWSDLDHRHVSGIEVLREMARTQGGSRAILMPVVFTTLIDLEYMEGMSQLGPLVCMKTKTAQVWLDHQVREHQGELLFNWDSVDALFPEGLLEDMFQAFSHLLKRLADEGESWQASDWGLLPSWQTELISELNSTEAPLPEGAIQSRIAEQVQQRPDHPAVVSSQRTLSYRELFQISCRIGARLREIGARPNHPVAIVMDKGWEQVAGVLGILQSGAAYLPIDPEFPKERIEYLFDHGQTKVALTQSWLEGNVAWPEGIQRLCVDDEQVWQGADDQPLEPAQNADDLAYVLYTSGSTGEPKGVMIEHRNVLNRMPDVNRRFGVNSADRVIALTALQHDLSVYDLFGGLFAGATLVIPDAAQRRDPAHWADLMVRQGVTVWNSVPAFMQMLVDYLENAPNQDEVLPRTLRLVILSGDWIPVSLPDRLRALLPDVRFISAGGPTETTVWDICNPLESVDPEWKSIPYGRPMTNASYHILNQRLQLCPVWVTGEMYIGGVGLARGFWRDEEKTRERFIRHPQTGERLYRCGDLGRYLPDGNIEIMGRADFQIKIRGYRIEPGEIEATLEQHPQVRKAIVMATGETSEDKQLVAYVESRQPDSEEAEGIPRGQTEASSDFASKGELLDPLERIQFKFKNLNLRPAEPESSSIQLKQPEVDDDLLGSYLARQSYRNFLDQPISLEAFGDLLSCLLPLKTDEIPLPKFRYPSAGSLYPVQVYLYIKPGRIEGLEPGVYYFHPHDHRLVLLSQEARIGKSIHTENNYPLVEASAFSLFLIGALDAVAPMYGEIAERFCLLEAGYMSQLLMTEAPKSGIGLCPLGGVNFEAVREQFRLSESHLYIHGLVGGLLSPGQSREFSVLQDDSTTPPASGAKGSSLSEDLRSFLKEKLPSYMVPSGFMVLDRLPLTPNGKVDRAQLSRLDSSPADSGARYVAPQSELEETIAKIWSEVLKIEEVGIEDNFFDIAGNSMRVLQVHRKLQEALPQSISVVDLFAYPTIRALAQHLGNGGDDGQSLQKSRDRAAARRRSRGRRGR